MKEEKNKTIPKINEINESDKLEKSEAYLFLKNEINKAIPSKFKTVLELANESGVHQGNLSSFLNGKRDGLNFETAYKILQTLNIPIGEQKQKATIKRIEKNAPLEEIQENNTDLVKINIYQITGAGNPFDLQENEPITSIFINANYAEQSDLALLVNGDSMYPTIKNNAIVGISINKNFQPNEIFAINHPIGGVTIKRVSIKEKSYIIRSDNPNKELYPQEEYAIEDYPELIIGRVVWVWQSM